MKVSIQSTPTVNVTVAKNRQKIYGESKIFLKDSTEFEVELFNPTTDTILAKISLNGDYINGGGLILYPGQRVYLERYLDNNNRFKFETYTVERHNSEVQGAIRNNGTVSVEFFKEKKWQKINSSCNFYTNTSSVTFDSCQSIFNAGTTTNTEPYTFTSDVGSTTTGSACVNYSADLSMTNIKCADITGSAILNEVGEALTKRYCNATDSLLETGRIAEGSKSDQSFTEADVDFETAYFHKITYALLPETEKQMHAEDIRVHCSNCGNRRRKDSWKFCPSCGSNYDE